MDVLTHLMPQAEQVEVLHAHYEATNIRFEANRLKTSAVEETSGVAVRVVKDGRVGFAASSDMTALDKLAHNVMESAQYSESVPIVFPGPQTGPDVVTFDAAIAELPVTRMVDIGKEIVAYLRDIDPEVLVNVAINRGIQRVNIRNQAGAAVSFERSPFFLMANIERVKGDDVLLIYDMLGTTVWEANYMAFVRKLGEKLKLAQQITTLKPGRMPVLFSPTGAVTLALPLMDGINGRNVYKGTSPMRDKVGEKLFDEKITLVDDPIINGKFGSATYDDEGVPHRRNVLIGGGVLNGFLYDLKTAAQSGVASTGNGSRGLFNRPSPAPTNLLIAPGTTPLAEMVAGIDEGLLVENVLGLGQGNTISGAFSNPLAVGFKIEKGKIVGRVKDLSIAGNVYEVLGDQGAHNVVAVSRETEWIYTNFNLPYILLEDMNVAGKA